MISAETLQIMGIIAPKDHQRAISKINTGLANLYYSAKTIHLEPLPETMIDEGQTSPVPDIMLYDNERYITPVIIEVSHAAGVRNDFKKVQRLIEDEDFGTIEGFVFDYINRKWRKYRKGIGEILNDPSYSDVLGIDLHQVMIP